MKSQLLQTAARNVRWTLNRRSGVALSLSPSTLPSLTLWCCATKRLHCTPQASASSRCVMNPRSPPPTTLNDDPTACARNLPPPGQMSPGVEGTRGNATSPAPLRPLLPPREEQQGGPRRAGGVEGRPKTARGCRSEAVALGQGLPDGRAEGGAAAAQPVRQDQGAQGGGEGRWAACWGRGEGRPRISLMLEIMQRGKGW